MQSGGGYGAFNFLTPTEALGDAATAQQRVTGSQLATALLPDEISQSHDKTGMSTLALAQAQKSALAKDTGADQQLIANAASLATDAGEWDDAMQTLADKGVPEARQFIGRYSTGLQQRVAHGYSASTPGSSLEAMQSDNPTGGGAAQSGLATVGGEAGAGVTAGGSVTNYDQMFAGQPAAKIQEAYGHFEKMRAAIDAVSSSPNPSAEWDQQVTALGHPEWAGQYSPQKLQQLTQETVPIDNYLRGRLTREGLGAPGPKVAAKIDKVGDQMFSIDETDPAHPKVSPLTQGKSVFVGTNADGHGIYYNPDTRKETIGDATMATSKFNRGSSSVYAAKQAAWLSVHPGDTSGALAYAGGTGGKNLSPEQIQVAAMHQAVAEMSSESLAGNPPKDPEAFVRSRSQEIAQDISSKASAPQTAPGGTTPPAGGASQQKNGYPVLSAAESHAAAANPANKGKGYYGADGVFRRF